MQKINVAIIWQGLYCCFRPDCET